MSTPEAKKLRIGIIGSCQVTGLSLAARHFLPGAEVRSWHVGVYPSDTDEEILSLVSDSDLVITQIARNDDHGCLSKESLRGKGVNAAYLPVFAFAGFHPDITYIKLANGTFVHGTEAPYNSLLAAAAFAIGLAERRVPALFNAYVFSELGYFEVFPAAKRALISNYMEAGYDLEPLLVRWFSQSGQFMYGVNHPNISVLLDLCRMVLIQQRLIEQTVPVPPNVHDFLGTHFTWPLYPPLAKRLNLLGSWVFGRNENTLPPGVSRELPLTEMIGNCFAAFSKWPKAALLVDTVAAATERLSRLVVC